MEHLLSVEVDNGKNLMKYHNKMFILRFTVFVFGLLKREACYD